MGHRCSKYLHERWVSKTQKTLHKYSSDWLYELIHFSCTLVLSFPTEFQAIKFYCHKGFAGNELQSCTQENSLMKGTWAERSKEQEQQLCKTGPLCVWGNNPNVKLCVVSTSLIYAFFIYSFFIKQLNERGNLEQVGPLSGCTPVCFAFYHTSNPLLCACWPVARGHAE